MITEIIEKNGIKAKVRNGTSDSFVVKECVNGEYRKLNISESDIIVDIGLNIGMFTCYALSKGANEVHSFEPDLDNFELAKFNVDLNGFSNRCFLYNHAVVGNQDIFRDFFINVKKNKGAHSLIGKRGRDKITVTCANINKIIEQVKPTILKLDCEGGEYEILKSIKSFSKINQIIMEFHHAHLNDKDKSKFHEIIELMEQNYNHVEYRKEPKGAWVSIIYCKNDS
jgi:FkbM family methyltransferase